MSKEKIEVKTRYGTVIIYQTKGELSIRIPRAPNNTIYFEQENLEHMDIDLQFIETAIKSHLIQIGK